MSEDNQWRQLGSIVNAVLLDARTKAIRAGTVSETAAPSFTRKAAHTGGAFSIKKAGNGFLRQDTPAAQAPVQLELPFGIAAVPDAKFGVARAPRGARLM
ncbi:MAG: hypothetical protein ACLP7P_20910 [Rhodomicrobium sp.]